MTYFDKIKKWCLANNIPEDEGGIDNYDHDGYSFAEDSAFCLLYTAKDGSRKALALNLNYNQFVIGDLTNGDDGWYRLGTTEIEFDEDGVETIQSLLAKNTEYTPFPTAKFED